MQKKKKKKNKTFQFGDFFLFLSWELLSLFSIVTYQIDCNVTIERLKFIYDYKPSCIGEVDTHFGSIYEFSTFHSLNYLTTEYLKGRAAHNLCGLEVAKLVN